MLTSTLWQGYTFIYYMSWKGFANFKNVRSSRGGFCKWKSREMRTSGLGDAKWHDETYRTASGETWPTHLCCGCDCSWLQTGLHSAWVVRESFGKSHRAGGNGAEHMLRGGETARFRCLSGGFGRTTRAIFSRRHDEFRSVSTANRRGINKWMWLIPIWLSNLINPDQSSAR